MKTTTDSGIPVFNHSTKFWLTGNIAFKLLGNIAWWQGSYSRPVYDLQRRPMAEYLVDMEMLVFGYRSFSGLRNTTCQVWLTKRLQIFWKELLHCRHHDFDYCFSVICGGTRTQKLKMHCFPPRSTSSPPSPSCCFLSWKSLRNTSESKQVLQLQLSLKKLTLWLRKGMVLLKRFRVHNCC